MGQQMKGEVEDWESFFVGFKIGDIFRTLFIC